MFLITPLSFDASSPRNLGEYLHRPYIARNYSHCATSLLLIVCVYLHSIFRGWLRKTQVFWNVVHNGFQGHTTSLILVPIESAYVTSYWSSIVTLVLAPFKRYCRFSVQNSDSTPIPPKFWGYSPWTRLLMSWLLVANYWCNYFRTSPDGRRDRRRDGQTDGRLTIAIQR